ncbi:MAG: hypothetical protein Q9159_006681 [Coniocarpon cinnabarinum]
MHYEKFSKWETAVLTVRKDGVPRKRGRNGRRNAPTTSTNGTWSENQPRHEEHATNNTVYLDDTFAPNDRVFASPTPPQLQLQRQPRFYAPGYRPADDAILKSLHRLEDLQVILQEPSIPDPPRFHERRKYGLTFRTWQRQIRNKFEVEERRYISQVSKVRYVLNLLSGAEYDALAQHCSDPAMAFIDVDELFEFLETLVEDSERENWQVNVHG